MPPRSISPPQSWFHQYCQGLTQIRRVGTIGSLLSMKGWSSLTLTKSRSTAVKSNVSAQPSNLSLVSMTQTSESGSASPSTTSPPTSMSTAGRGSLRVAHLTEQISHHPPISAYVASCLAWHIVPSGIDHIAVRVLPSASLRVASGTVNKGLFVHIDGGPDTGEHYQTTLPSHMSMDFCGVVSTLLCLRAPLSHATAGLASAMEVLHAMIQYKEEVRAISF